MVFQMFLRDKLFVLDLKLPTLLQQRILEITLYGIIITFESKIISYTITLRI